MTPLWRPSTISARTHVRRGRRWPRRLFDAVGGTCRNCHAVAFGGVIFGALIMAALLNGMTLLAVAPEVKFIARGAVLALAVWLDVKLGAATHESKSH
mgnify:CR=1 FL=1